MKTILHFFKTSSKEAHAVFIFISLLFGVVFAYSTPPMWGVDEVAHFNRSYQVSSGQLLPYKNVSGNYGGLMPVNSVAMQERVYGDLTNIKGGSVLGRSDVPDIDIYKDLGDDRLSEQMVEVDFPGAASYSPIAYVAPALGVGVGRVLDLSLNNIIFLARVFSLLVYVGITSLALWYLRNSKLKWLVFIVALLPMTLYQGSIINVDGIVNALSFLFFALMVVAFSKQRMPRYALLILGVAAILLPVLKPNYGLFSLALLLIPYDRISTSKRISIVYKVVVMAVMAVCALVWLYVSKDVSSYIGSMRGESESISVLDQILFVIQHPYEFIRAIVYTLMRNDGGYATQTTGLLGWNFVGIPFFAAIPAYIAITFAGLYSRVEVLAYKYGKMVFGILSLLCFVSIFGVLYLTFTPVGQRYVDGVQGRYFIPLIPFAVTYLATLVPVEVDMKPANATWLFSLVSVVILAISVVYYLLATY